MLSTDGSMSNNEILPEVVYVARNRLEAEVVRGRLQSAGIPAILQYESAGVVYGLTVDGMGETRVLVPTHLAEEARHLLAEVNRGEEWKMW